MTNNYELNQAEQTKYSKEYSDQDFLDKTRYDHSGMGVGLLRKAYQLYFLIKSDKVPFWAKTMSMGALGYLILPVDMIPDFIPVVGYSDDAAVIAAAYFNLVCYIDPEIERKTDDALERLLG